MDKQQNELKKAYFRSRKQAIKDMPYEGFEIKFLRKNLSEDDWFKYDYFISEWERADYYNDLFGFDFNNITRFNKYGHALATSYHGKPMFIKKDGTDGINEIDVKEFKEMNANETTQYLNIKNNTDRFGHVSPFHYADNQLASAQYIDGGRSFVNVDGKISVKEFKANQVAELASQDKKTFMFTINPNRFMDNDYLHVFEDLYADNTLFKIKDDPDNGPMFVNFNGENSVDNINANDFARLDRYDKATYFNTIRKNNNLYTAYHLKDDFYGVQFTNGDDGVIDSSGNDYNKYHIPIFNSFNELLEYLNNNENYSETRNYLHQNNISINSMRDLSILEKKLNNELVDHDGIDNDDYEHKLAVYKSIGRLIADNNGLL